MDLYGKCFPLGDYINEPFGVWTYSTDFGNAEITIEGLQKVKKRKGLLLKTVAQRYYANGSPNKAKIGDRMDRAIKNHDLKVSRLNRIAILVNSQPEDVTLFKRAHNEIIRLLYGKGEDLFYPELDFSPDLLQI